MGWFQGLLYLGNGLEQPILGLIKRTQEENRSQLRAGRPDYEQVAPLVDTSGNYLFNPQEDKGPLGL